MIVGMYLRTTQRRNKDGSIVRYYALAENVRHPEKGHVEAKVVHSFGRADRLDRAALERLVRSIRRVLEADDGETPADEKSHARAIEIEASFELGVVHVVEQLWAQLGIGQAIAARLEAQELQAPHEAALLAMAAQRLARPGSKLACHERWLDRVWLPQAKDLALGQLYRALDLLAEHGDAIEQEVFWHSVDLFKLDVDLVFYDATTAWFECAAEDVADHEWRGLSFAPLRKRGHSKEGRDNDPQVIIALAVTRDGMPVRSWVLPGDAADVTAVQQIKEDLRQMRLGRALFVGDAGLYAKANLAELSRGAGRYILATPIGRVKEIKDEVLSRPGRYAEITPNLRAKEVIIGAGERALHPVPERRGGRAGKAPPQRASGAPAARARPSCQRSPQGGVSPGRLPALRPLPVAGRTRPAIHRSDQGPPRRAVGWQVRAHHQRRHALGRRHRARL
jgi:hypothetical protein